MSADSTNSEADKAATGKLQEEFRADIQYMLTHVRKEGIPLPDTVAKDASAVLSGARISVSSDPPDTVSDLMYVHGKLSALIAPATPTSLAATDWSRPDKSWSVVLLMGLLVLVAILGLVGYIYTLQFVSPAQTPTPTPTATLAPTSASGTLVTRMSSGASWSLIARPIASTTLSAIAQDQNAPQNQMGAQWNFVCAALLGASLAGLFKALDHIQDRSFDPSYTPDYYIRLVIGALAGVVLATVGAKLFENNETLGKLGPGIIALLGGYSAQAVRQILDRLVEILVTAVKGQDGSGAQKERLDIASGVLSITQSIDISKPGMKDLKDQLDALLKKLRT